MKQTRFMVDIGTSFVSNQLLTRCQHCQANAPVTWHFVECSRLTWLCDNSQKLLVVHLVALILLIGSSGRASNCHWCTCSNLNY